MKTIGFVDYYPVIRTGFLNLFEHNPDSFKCVACADITQLKATSQDMDIVILGLNEQDSPVTCRLVDECLAAFPDASVVVFDQNSNSRLVITYFKKGVRGYLLKAEPTTEFARCFDAVSSGKHYLSPMAWSVVLSGQNTNSVRKPGTAKLTRRESEVAELLLKGNRTTQVAAALHLKPSTISTMKQNVLKKFNVRNLMELKEVMSESRWLS